MPSDPWVWIVNSSECFNTGRIVWQSSGRVCETAHAHWVWHKDTEIFKELNLLGEVESQCKYAKTLTASAEYERAYYQVPKPDPGEGKLYKSSNLFMVS